jgi:hypothetical protein
MAGRRRSAAVWSIRVASVPLGIAAGLAAAGLTLIWLLATLLLSDGATWRLLLPWLLFLLPLLGIGAAVGWLLGLGLRALAGTRR